MKVTITDAAKMAGISRQQFYRSYINTNQISIIREDKKKVFIDVSELLRVFPNIKLNNQDTINNVTNEQNVTNSYNNNNEVVTLLKEQITSMKDQLREAVELREWFKQQLQEQLSINNKLLEEKTPKRKKWLFSWFKKT